MKHTWILLILLIPTLANAEYKFADNWTWTDTAYQAVFLGITYVDWKQTHWMASHNWQWDGKQYHETNPFLGDFPDSGTVDKLVPIGMVLHTLIAMALPSKFEVYDKNYGTININFRRIWQCVWILGEAGAVYKNYSIGVGMEF